MREDLQEEGDIKITSLEGEHRCIAGPATFSTASSEQWLQDVLPTVLSVTRDTKIHTIIKTMRVQFHEIVLYITGTLFHFLVIPHRTRTVQLLLKQK